MSLSFNVTPLINDNVFIWQLRKENVEHDGTLHVSNIIIISSHDFIYDLLVLHHHVNNTWWSSVITRCSVWKKSVPSSVRQTVQISSSQLIYIHTYTWPSIFITIAMSNTFYKRVIIARYYSPTHMLVGTSFNCLVKLRSPS